MVINYLGWKTRLFQRQVVPVLLPEKEKATIPWHIVAYLLRCVYMKYTIQSFNKDFRNNETCLKYLFESLYSGSKCPACKKAGNYHLQANTSHFVCSCGGHQISPKQGTIFEKSSTDLYKWFFAMYLFSTAKNGVSAKELERQLGVTYKTAWRMAYQIRQLMDQMPDMFDGTVEANETYNGGKRKGKRKGKRGRGAEGKTPVIGIHKRGGGVYAKAVVNTKASTVMVVVRENVKVGATLMTDEYRSYGKASKMGYKHETVNHGQ